MITASLILFTIIIAVDSCCFQYTLIYTTSLNILFTIIAVHVDSCCFQFIQEIQIIKIPSINFTDTRFSVSCELHGKKTAEIIVTFLAFTDRRFGVSCELHRGKTAENYQELQ